MEFFLYILAGAVVGLAVGLTGVGGGSLMTPILLAFGFPLHIAVGTDLLFAAITKSGAAVAHTANKSVRWDLVLLMAAGSLPATVLTILMLRYVFQTPEAYSTILTTTLGLALILTSAAIIFRAKFARSVADSQALSPTRVKWLTPVLGGVLGVLVTLSSIGAGAIATALLLIFYPKLKSLHVVGTDIAHAVPLTLFAGLGHLYLGNVDFLLLLALLVGSLPAVSLGSKLAKFVPDQVLRPILASLLCIIGVKFAFF